MGPLGHARSRMIAKRGRVVTLVRRNPAPTPATRNDVLGFLRGYAATELVGGLQQGDASLETCVLPAPFTPPVKGDLVVLDGRTWAVLGAATVSEGAAVIGFTMTIRGG